MPASIGTVMLAARLVEEAVEVLIVVEELGNQVSDAGINLDFEVFDVLVQRVSLIVAFRVASTKHLEVRLHGADV